MFILVCRRSATAIVAARQHAETYSRATKHEGHEKIARTARRIVPLSCASWSMVTGEWSMVKQLHPAHLVPTPHQRQILLLIRICALDPAFQLNWNTGPAGCQSAGSMSAGNWRGVVAADMPGTALCSIRYVCHQPKRAADLIPRAFHRGLNQTQTSTRCGQTRCCRRTLSTISFC